MKIKTFTGGKMSDVLTQVRRTLGKNAVILHTRSFRQGGILGLGARTVVEVTAVEGREIARVGRQKAAPSRPSSGHGRNRQAESREVHSEPIAAGDLIRRTYAAAQAELVQRQAQDRNPLFSSRAESRPDHDQLSQEMSAVKRMVSRMLYQQSRGDSGVSTADMPEKLMEQYLALLEQEVTEELAQQVIEQVKTESADADTDDEDILTKKVLEALAALIPADEHPERIGPTKDGRPRTIALIGPTGVGKTTTIAKLAANFKLKQKHSVSLVTLDTYRIAAVEQLQTYADIIGVPLYVVTKPDEMVEVSQRCGGSDVVLLDTAGRSQRDDPKLEQLDSFLRASRPHEVHLVLSSTCSQSVLLETIERFSKIQTDRIIFTKLDEAVTFGVLLNVAHKVNKRLSFLTTGQEVPHQIEPSRPDRLAALLLGQQTIPGPSVDVAERVLTAGNGGITA